MLKFDFESEKRFGLRDHDFVPLGKKEFDRSRLENKLVKEFVKVPSQNQLSDLVSFRLLLIGRPLFGPSFGNGGMESAADCGWLAANRLGVLFSSAFKSQSVG